jgi:hypothetical protein
MTSEAVVQELLEKATTAEEFIGPHQIEAWAEILRQRPAPEVFEALLGVFAVRDGMAQQAAGELLLAVRPACTLPIPEAIRQILPTWNVSVEEVVEYFEALFGREELLRALDEVGSQHLPEREQVALDTIHYWISAFSQGHTSRCSQ